MQATDFRVGEKVQVELWGEYFDMRQGRFWRARAPQPIQVEVYGRNRFSMDVETEDGAVIRVNYWQVWEGYRG